MRPVLPGQRLRQRPNRSASAIDIIAAMGFKRWFVLGVIGFLCLAAAFYIGSALSDFRILVHVRERAPTVIMF